MCFPNYICSLVNFLHCTSEKGGGRGNVSDGESHFKSASRMQCLSYDLLWLSTNMHKRCTAS